MSLVTQEGYDRGFIWGRAVNRYALNLVQRAVGGGHQFALMGGNGLYPHLLHPINGGGEARSPTMAGVPASNL